MQASRARYRVVALAIGLAILSYIQRVAISQAAGPISKDLHLNKTDMGLVFGAFGLSYALFELPMGLWGDRIGVRRVLIQIVLAWSTFTALTGAAWNLASMYVIRFAFGAGEAGCFPNLTRMLSVWLPARERVTAQSLMWACTRWGGAVTPPIVLAIVTLFGWRWAFVAFALLGVLWCIVFFAWFKNSPSEHLSVNPAELELIETTRNLRVHSAEDQSQPQNWLSILLTPQVAILVLQYFCFSFVWYFYVTWLPTYLIEERGQTPAHAATLSVLPLFFGGFGSLLSGLLPIRIPRRKIAFCGFLGAAALLFTVTQVHAVLPAMLCMALASFCSDLTMPISWNACVDIGGSYTATVAATMNMLGNLAGFVAPVIGGIILQRTGGHWNPLLYLMVGSSTISALCWLYLNPHSQNDPQNKNPAISVNNLQQAADIETESL